MQPISGAGEVRAQAVVGSVAEDERLPVVPVRDRGRPDSRRPPDRGWRRRSASISIWPLRILSPTQLEVAQGEARHARRARRTRSAGSRPRPSAPATRSARTRCQLLGVIDQRLDDDDPAEVGGLAARADQDRDDHHDLVVVDPLAGSLGAQQVGDQVLAQLPRGARPPSSAPRAPAPGAPLSARARSPRAARTGRSRGSAPGRSRGSGPRRRPPPRRRCG